MSEAIGGKFKCRFCQDDQPHRHDAEFWESQLAFKNAKIAKIAELEKEAEQERQRWFDLTKKDIDLRQKILHLEQEVNHVIFESTAKDLKIAELESAYAEKNKIIDRLTIYGEPKDLKSKILHLEAAIAEKDLALKAISDCSVKVPIYEGMVQIPDLCEKALSSSGSDILKILEEARKTLEKVEFIEGHESYLNCAWCDEFKPEHLPDCQRQSVLSRIKEKLNG